MGTPEFSAIILKSLLQEPEIEIVGVFTQPDRASGRGLKMVPLPVKNLALATNLPLFQPETFKNEESFCQLATLHPDVIVVASYGLILPEKVLNLAPCINVHASLLPAWRGAAPIQAALLDSWKEDAQSGISIMAMQKGVDTGPVYCMTATPTWGKTWEELNSELAWLGAGALNAVLKNLDRIEPVPQPESGITYASKLSRNDGVIDWSKPAAQIEARIRAMNPWPGAHAVLEMDNRSIEIAITSARVSEFAAEPVPGRVRIDKNGLLAACGDGWLQIISLKPSGRKMMNAKAFANGYLAGISTAAFKMVGKK